MLLRKKLPNVKGSLMGEIWLQSNPGYKYLFIYPTSKAKLTLWIIRSANYGFKDRTALANSAKFSIGKFYNSKFHP